MSKAKRKQEMFIKINTPYNINVSLTQTEVHHNAITVPTYI